MLTICHKKLYNNCLIFKKECERLLHGLDCREKTVSQKLSQDHRSSEKKGYKVQADHIIDKEEKDIRLESKDKRLAFHNQLEKSSA
ncbi:hypothetical protein A2966_02070 [Candidatus Roizmanbacteria bacterium RIFCSPLOWO2_01_FULL_41_22]|uniref:Uncharacterized protein n=1 Tax=Candidatus Roizmanbacteria bacterium RIFCSPLOWO2_01_FULL_41_22 TaxID=1802067 RepID=A0A1F7J975_9BACT|nr:MAG: hypothetical protein A2966_02070 [Candidatus Roizmanbacteria bacterium RIFCSPLOWO2_01_FULL_41_22]